MKLKIIFLFFLAFFLTCTGIYGQKASKKTVITGHVTDSKGKSVQGAMIFVDKNKTEQVTDENGFYRIKVRSDAGEISVFSTLCGAGKSSISGNPVVDIVISGTMSVAKQQEKTETEEKVNVGYSDLDQKQEVSPANKIDQSKVKFENYNNIYDMIRGQVPGVEVIGKSIRIRGTNTILGSTDPLTVVNGIVVQSIDDINPRDVKSIEILKGSSASIYGSRGSNGVILINLKSAKDPQ